MNSWVPLFQTLAWIGLIVFGVWRFNDPLRRLADALRRRILAGSAVKAGFFELGEQFEGLDRVEPSNKPAPADKSQWAEERDKIYQENDGFFLVHAIEPSYEAGQLYDIFIYLVRHKSDALEDVEYAEFFLGAYWDNNVYRETLKDGMIGISTSAYGPFLCTCRVYLKNGKTGFVYRYIDFEMGRVFENAQLTKASRRRTDARA